MKATPYRWVHVRSRQLGVYQREVRRLHPSQRDRASQPLCIEGDMRGSTHHIGEFYLA